MINISKKQEVAIIDAFVSNKDADASMSMFELLDLYRPIVEKHVEHKVKINDWVNTHEIVSYTIDKVVSEINEGKYANKGNLLSFMRRVAHNKAIDYFRKVRVRDEVKNSEKTLLDISTNTASDELNAEEGLIYQQILLDVNSAIAKLPKEQFDVVMLRYFENMSFQEIADATNVSINTALGRMRYALHNLRKIIGVNTTDKKNKQNHEKER